MLWTVAEGAIYADFDKNIHIVDNPPKDITRYYAGVDWGYDHFGSIVIIGETDDGVAYIVDGIAETGQHIDWWIDRAKEFIDKYGNIKFYSDSARPEHVADFKRNGIKATFAKKEVIAGIEEVAKGWTKNKLFYVKNAIPRFEDEIYQYRWKENSAKDEPIKEYDDVLDALRYALYTEHKGKMKVKLFKGGV